MMDGPLESVTPGCDEKNRTATLESFIVEVLISIINVFSLKHRVNLL